MPLLEELEKLKTESEIGDTTQRLNQNLQTSAIEIRRQLEAQLPIMISQLVRDEVSKIKVRDGRDADEIKIINKVVEKVFEKIDDIEFELDII